MSHVVQIQTEVRDPVALRSACRRLGLGPPAQREVKRFSQPVSGLAVELAGWRYPVVFDLTSGQTKFDNYQGRWGEQQELNKLLQAYAAEKATLEARRQGHSVIEQLRSDGSIQLTIAVGEGS